MTTFRLHAEMRCAPASPCRVDITNYPLVEELVEGRCTALLARFTGDPNAVGSVLANYEPFTTMPGAQTPGLLRLSYEGEATLTNGHLAASFPLLHQERQPFASDQSPRESIEDVWADAVAAVLQDFFGDQGQIDFSDDTFDL